jgi:hypothetical protein
MIASYVQLDKGLEALIVRLLHDEMVPDAEEQLAKRLERICPSITAKDAKIVLDFATCCGYVVKLNQQLVLTESGQKRAKSYKKSAAVAPIAVPRTSTLFVGQ